MGRVRTRARGRAALDEGLQPQGHCAPGAPIGGRLDRRCQPERHRPGRAQRRAALHGAGGSRSGASSTPVERSELRAPGAEDDRSSATRCTRARPLFREPGSGSGAGGSRSGASSQTLGAKRAPGTRSGGRRLERDRCTRARRLFREPGSSSGAGGSRTRRRDKGPTRAICM
jgi:hypothetical protein